MLQTPPLQLTMSAPKALSFRFNVVVDLDQRPTVVGTSIKSGDEQIALNVQPMPRLNACVDIALEVQSLVYRTLVEALQAHGYDEPF